MALSMIVHDMNLIEGFGPIRAEHESSIFGGPRKRSSKDTARL